MSKDIEGIVDSIIAYEDRFFTNKTKDEQKEWQPERRDWHRTTLKSQADQYEREKGEMVRDMYQLIENAMKEAHVIATDDDFRSGYFWGLKHLQVEALEIIKQKYGVDLSE